NKDRTTLLPLLLLLVFLLSLKVNARLRVGFYRDVCPNLESIVRNAVQIKLQETVITAPGTLRLYFHDCFVRGCDASIMLVSPDGRAERNNPINLSLAGDGFDTVIKAKAAVDSDPQCTNKVSCADILALAARDVVNLVGGPFYEVELGRRDGLISTITSVHHNLPLAGFNLTRLMTMFSNNNLSLTDLIALSGAHTIGVSHCNQFSKRLRGFSGQNWIDPTLNPQYAQELGQACPRGVDPDIAVFNDPITPNVFDNAYFKDLQRGSGLLSSDQVLFVDERSRGIVNQFAGNGSDFNLAFIEAITKMGRIGAKTGDEGEIRIDCTTTN
ncbi:hypothetical protein M569_13997, partial [Genlisea aurea]